MSLKKIQYPELGIDIEIEQLGSILKFFKHNDSRYFSIPSFKNSASARI